MEQFVKEQLRVLWDYMRLDMPLRQADCIVGFGCYNDDIARRAAELYHQGWAPKVLFSGGLGRNTRDLWTVAEADRFAAIAMEAGVPAEDILIENKSTNTGENILFTKAMLEPLAVKRIIGIHKPFMERRVNAAMGVYWPEMDAVITSPRQNLEEYMAASMVQGMTEQTIIEVMVGDFQRMDVYAKKGFQLPQYIPDAAWQAFHALVARGYDGELVR